MKNKSDIICFSSIDWSFNWQGQQQISRMYAKQGHRVLYVENTGVRSPTLKDLPRLRSRIKNWKKGISGIFEIDENIFVFSPLLLPFPYSRIAIFLNSLLFGHIISRWCKAMDFHNPIIWAFLPTAITRNTISKTNHSMLVYYYTDDFSNSSVSAKRIYKDEIKMIESADIVFAHSQKGMKRCSSVAKSLFYFPYGVDLNYFSRKECVNKPADLDRIKPPYVGYIGGIHKWIDFDLVREVALAHPNISFVFVGPIQVKLDLLKKIPNIYFLREKEYTRLPDYIHFFDVCWIPYQIVSYTDSVCPAKLNEYLAMGKKVVSTPLKELVYYNNRNSNIVSFAVSPSDFSDVFKKTFASSEDQISEHVAVAKKYSWENLFLEMNNLINQKQQEKLKLKKSSWKTYFMKIYPRLSFSALSCLASILLGYLILFHTPAIWVMAQHLKVEKPYEGSVDVALVMGGGVGESGKVGQGYQERVSAAVSLYKEKAAKKIIFSSGYTYLMKEAEVMKALAISYGIPEEDIYVDDSSKNTFEAVQHSSSFLSQHKLNRIVLLSSSYHMLRVSLTARKQYSKSVEFYLKPLEKNFFYRSLRSGPKYEQLRALLHEVLAILYYRWKSYL